VIFGSGPGALPSDAYMLGIDPMVQRDRQDEAIGVIRKLLSGAPRFSHESDWFTLRDARLQLLPLQENLPFAVASMVSPSGMTLAGKHGTGVLSIGSMSTAGIAALPLQWSFAEEAAAISGATINRGEWRIVMTWHIAETREQARKEARDGLLRWHNEYTVGTLMRPGAVAFKDADDAVDQTAFAEGSAAVIGTPDDSSVAARHGEIDWRFRHRDRIRARRANREATLRSWDPHRALRGPGSERMLDSYRESQRHVIEHRDIFERAGAAVISKIMQNERAAKALTQESNAASAMPAHHAPKV
jgi:limonene 1,2-monooxygenase